MITLILFICSLLAIGIAAWTTRSWMRSQHSPDLMAKLMRILFCIMAGLSIWSISVYCAWLLGFELDVGTVREGNMGSHAWLPPLTLIFTVAVYHTAKPRAHS